MVGFVDVCRFTPTAGGTTDWTFSAAVTGYQSPASAGIINSQTYRYRAESADLTQWEIGTGTYNTGTNVLTRTTVLFNSSGTGTGSGQSGAGTKINFSTVPQVAIVALNEDFRELLVADRTYFVRSDGSDSNSGLINSAAGAFLTWAAAYNFLARSVDFGGHTVTLFNGNAATYTTGIFLQNNSWTGGGDLIIDFNGGGINTATGPKAFLLDSAVPGVVTLQNGTLSTAVGSCIEVTNGKVQLGAGLTLAGAGSSLLSAENYGGQISGSGSSFTVSATTVGGGVISATFGGQIYLVSATITLTANINLGNSFAIATDAGQIQAALMTFTLGGHTVTGQHFQVLQGGLINTGGGGANYFPGSAVGQGSNYGVTPFGMYL